MSEDASASGRRRWGSPSLQALGSFLTYLAASVLIWGLPVVGHLSTRYLSNDQLIGDADFFRWTLAWTPWALTHGQSPWFTERAFAPLGGNLTWTAVTPGPAIVAWPITRIFGTLVSYNLWMLLAPALAGWGAYLVCKRVTHSFWPSLIGGHLFGFSTYVVNQMHHNLNLVLIFPVPIAVYLVLRRADGSMTSTRFVALMTITLLGLFSVSPELLATTALFGGMAFILAFAVAAESRKILIRTATLTAVSFTIVGALMFPVYVLPALQAPNRPPYDFAKTSVDLLGFVVPRSQVLIGGTAFETLTDRFTASFTSDGSYIGIAGVSMLIGFAITERRRKETWALLSFVAVVSLLALGPVLHIAGRPSIALPGALLTKVPIMRGALAQRFPAYAALGIGVIASMWLARAHGWQRWLRSAFAVCAAVMLLPSIHSPPWYFDERTPTFFTDGTFRSWLGPDENVALIPGSKGETLLWQAAAGFSFRIPAGYVGPSGPRGLEPFHNGLWFQGGRPHPPERLRSWLTDNHVTAIVLGDLGRGAFETLIRSIGFGLVYQGGGVSVWRPQSA
jgi:hypothetical protein